MNNLTAWQGSSSREAIRGISFSPDDRRFATASDDSSVRIWSFAESKVESVLTGRFLAQCILSAHLRTRIRLGRQVRGVASYEGFTGVR